MITQLLFGLSFLIVSVTWLIIQIRILCIVYKDSKQFKSILNKMRDATKEEQGSVSNYIRSISIDSGVNFYDDI